MRIERCPQGHFFDGDRYHGCPLCPPEPDPEPFRPTVGWLVCGEEPFKGKDFRLHEGRNLLGNSPQADISLFWDGEIREQAALLCFDRETGLFTFGPKSGGSAEVNGAPIYDPVILRPGDRLRVGDTVLQFVPLEWKKVTIQ